MPAYATVDDLRIEGVSADISDALLEARVRRASALIDNYTHRWFYPRAQTITLDGTNSSTLFVGQPIISVSQVRVLDAGVENPALGVVDMASLRVYNRHLTQNLTDPDDRLNPKIQFVGGRLSLDGGFWRGVQNIEVTGLFGYTEFDAGETLWSDDLTQVGKTPEVIHTACLMLVVRDLLPLADLEGRAEAAASGSIKQLRTRDQAITYAGNTTTAYAPGISGNPELEAMLAPYCRLGHLGAV